MGSFENSPNDRASVPALHSAAFPIGGSSKPKVIASVDTVVIGSPEDVQASQAESALRSGKHALVSSATFSCSYTFRSCLIYPL